MRSDSTRVSAEALNEVRTFIGETYGDKYLPAAPNLLKSPKGAQEAHEAIRPTGVTRRPQDVKAYLTKDELALYELIWRRFVASQMAPAVVDLTTVDISAGDYLFRATPAIQQFPGFTLVYQESREVEEEKASSKLLLLQVGEMLELRDFEPKQHFTKPPACITEASLIKEGDSPSMEAGAGMEPPPLELEDLIQVPYLSPEDLFCDLNRKDFTSEQSEIHFHEFAFSAERTYDDLTAYHLDVSWEPGDESLEPNRRNFELDSSNPLWS
jgi:hypothetical protein